jgi:Secretion system C-terminal sorting domain/SprB repeat
MQRIPIILSILLACCCAGRAYAVIGITGVTHASADDCDGAIDITAEGNAGPFTFAWSNGTEEEDQKDICPGTYTVTVTNTFGCTKVLVIEILRCKAEIPITVVNMEIVPVSPITFTGGAIKLVLKPTVYPLFFKWTDESGTIIATTEDLTNISPGNYCVTISGGCGSPVSACYEMPACSYVVPGAVNLSFSTGKPCPKTPTGSIDLTVNFGIAPFQYLWSNGATTQDLSGVPPKMYQVKVTDKNGCVASELVELKAVIEGIKLKSLKHACTLESLGKLEIEPFPTANYEFSWSNGVVQTGGQSTLEGLAVGDYCVTVKDLNKGCTLTQCWKIEAGLPSTSIGIKELTYTDCPVNNTTSCNGQIALILDEQFSNQASSVTGNGGYTNNIYAWSGPNNFNAISSSPELSFLCQGEYTVTVTDQDGCTIEKSITICCCQNWIMDGACATSNGTPIWQGQNYSDLTIKDPTIVIPSFANNYLGSIRVNYDYGVTPVYYNWEKVGDPNFIAHSQTINGVGPGTYCVTITDGCSPKDVLSNYLAGVNACYTIGYGFNSSVKHSCLGGHNGKVTFTMNKEIPEPITVAWGGGSKTFTGLGTSSKIVSIDNLAAGTYMFTITDGNNQSYYSTNIITESTSPSAYTGPLAEFASSQEYLSPFVAINPCLKTKIFNGGDPRIGWDWSSLNDLYPNNPDLVLHWPDGGGYGTMKFNAEGKYYLTGPTDYHVPEHQSTYKVSLSDIYGCEVEYCVEFGTSQRVPGVPVVTPVTIPGTNYSINAYTGCTGCDRCGPGFCRYNGNPCGTGGDYYKFKYTANDDDFPCRSGRLHLKCGESFNIDINYESEEFIDFNVILKINDDKTCNYKVGCLFTGIPDPFFPDATPIYVEAPEGVRLPCDEPPSGGSGGGGFVGVECEGEVVLELTDPSTCTGTSYCYSGTGAPKVKFNVFIGEDEGQCERTNGEGQRFCYNVINCAVIGKKIEIPIECPGYKLDDCDIARPAANGERSSSDKSQTTSASSSYFHSYPVPFEEYITIEFDTEITGVSTIALADITGKAIYSKQVASKEGMNSFVIQLSDTVPPGIYFLSLESPNHQRNVKKMVKQRE